MRVDFHSEATAELDETLQWYGQRSQAAAQGFALAVVSALEKIGGDPDRFPKIDRRHRACNLLRYPFQVVFRNDGTRILVIAVAHAKRRPGYWRGRG